MYKVFVKIQNNRIAAINSDAFLTDTEGWVQIDEGTGDRYAHAQGNYLPKPLYTDDGELRYTAVTDEDGALRIEEVQGVGA